MTHPHPGAIALTDAAARRVTEHFAGESLSEISAQIAEAAEQYRAQGYDAAFFRVSATFEQEAAQ